MPFSFTGFNPCFSGSCIRIYQGKISNERLFRFNPCFSGSCIRILDALAAVDAAGCFNPCFSGSCIRMQILILERGTPALASILVLVDLAFEFPMKKQSPMFLQSFNPCFSGSCIRIIEMLKHYLSLFGFNPCFSGSCIRIMYAAFISFIFNWLQSLF